MNVTIGGIARTVEITSFDKLGDVKVCMLTTTADGSVGFQQLNQEVIDTIYASFPVDTSSGEIASFEDGADNVPVRELKLNLEPYQNLNGYDSPWVGGAGKNLYNSKGLNAYTNSGITATESNGTLTLNGTATANAFFSILNTGYPSGTYTWSFNNSAVNSGVRISFRNTGGSYWSETRADAVNKVVTVTGEPDDLLLYVTSGTTLSNFTIKPQFEKGSTATSWTPYENICPIYPANGKNLLPNIDIATLKSINSTGTWNGNSYTRGGVTYTVNSDGSVSTSGTASENTYFYFVAQNTETLANIGLINGNKYTVNGCPSGGSDSTYRVQAQTNWVTNSDTGSGKTFTYSTGGTDTCRIAIQSGTNVDGKVFYPMLRPVEIADSTYVPYNAIGITRTGANLWDEEWELGSISGTTGQNSGSSTSIRCKNYIPVAPSTTYYMYVGTNVNNAPFFYDANKNFISRGSYIQSGTFTTPNNCYYMRIALPASYGSTYNNDISINYPSSVQTYEPYQGERYYPISDNPVYGGTLEVETGVLTVDKGYKSFDGSENWQRTSESSGIYRYNVNGLLTGSKRPTSNSSNANLMSNMYESKTANQTYLGRQGISQQANTDDVYVYDSTYSALTVTDWETHLGSNNLQVVYELATPITYQLTPTQVRTLLGVNNIWTDSGTVEVQYLANIGLYIQKIIGATEDDMVANQNISANKYFFVGEELYYSTSAISAGQTIVVGTNCIKTNLADALNALNS